MRVAVADYLAQVAHAIWCLLPELSADPKSGFISIRHLMPRQKKYIWDMMLRRQLFIILQVLLWIGFCLMPILFLPPRPEGGPHPAFHSPWGFIFVFVIKNIKFILLFYVHYLFLIPRYFNRQRYGLYVVLLGLLVALVVLLPFLTEAFEPHHREFGHHRHGHQHPHLGFSMDAGMHFFMTLIVTLFPFLLNSYRNWISVQKDKTDMELAFLKSQINHHFLFNSLNSIYTLSLQGNPRTSPSIHSLSFILRYVLDESVKRSTALRHELEYIQHYIELQRLRLNERIVLDYHVDGDAEELTISPMLLIPFVENCFKHGVSTLAPCRIHILITVKDGSLHLHTDNDVLPLQAAQTIESGIGVANVIKRLELDYSGRFSLHQEKQGERFVTDLKIKLT